jgi:hypothetical protein
VKKINLTMKIPVPVPAVAVCRPRAINCVLISSYIGRLTAQKSSKKAKIDVQKTTAGTGSGCEQALGHEL